MPSLNPLNWFKRKPEELPPEPVVQPEPEVDGYDEYLARRIEILTAARRDSNAASAKEAISARISENRESQKEYRAWRDRAK